MLFSASYFNLLVVGNTYRTGASVSAGLSVKEKNILKLALTLSHWLFLLRKVSPTQEEDFEA
ncbi:MAG: hypothetical protein LW852_07700 [Sediminibacterium sp.]|jgi:hypothetical protein|nr:hypothetical protein [Sediminibacterium sp.]